MIRWNPGFGIPSILAENLSGIRIENSWFIPIWLTLLIGTGISLLVFFLYRLQLDGSSRTIFRSWSYADGLAGIRLVAILIVLGMIAEWSYRKETFEKRQIRLIVDRSLSMGTIDRQRKGRDSQSEGQGKLSRFEKVQRWLLEEALDHWRDQYTVHLMSAGTSFTEHGMDDDQIQSLIRSWTPNEAESHLGDAIQRGVLLGGRESVAGIVFVTDGINSGGMSLVESAEFARIHSIPLWIINAGEKQLRPDIGIRDLLIEETVFQGDRVLASATLEYRDLESPNVHVRVIDEGSQSILCEEAISVDLAKSRHNLQLSWIAEKQGMIKVRIVLDPVASEKNLVNNDAKRTIEVRDAAIPVLLAQSYPSFEFRFLKHLLERTRQPANPNRPAFRLTSVLEQADPEYVTQDASSRSTMPVGIEEWREFDVVILGDISADLLSKGIQQSLSHCVREEGVGLMMIAGPRHMPHTFRNPPFVELLPVEPLDTVQSLPSTPFRWQLTKIGESWLPLRLQSSVEASNQTWSSLPSQTWYRTSLRPKPLAQVLAESVTNDGSQGEPLLIAQYIGSGRVLFQGTDESFQWQSYFGDDLYYQRYWMQLIRWLSANRSLKGNPNAEIVVDQKEYEVGQSVTITISGDFDLERKGFVPLQLLRENDVIQVSALPVPGAPHQMRATLEDLSEGDYRVEWSRGGELPTLSHSFRIQQSQGETVILDPDTVAMQAAANRSGGAFLSIAEAKKLDTLLPKGHRIVSGNSPKIPLWNHPIALGLVIGLLTLEWILRRRIGLI